MHTYEPLGEPRPHELFVVKEEVLAKILRTVEGTHGIPVFCPVPKFGVCLKLHYVGPRGGYCPLCDMEDGVDSRLLRVALIDEFPDHYFDYSGLFSMRGVEWQIWLCLPAAIDVDDDLPYLEVGRAVLVAFLWNVVGARVPSP